jgi:RND family efflux transporter MFP subunit
MLDAPNTLEPSVSPATSEAGHAAGKPAHHDPAHDDVGLVITPADPAKLKLAGLVGGAALVAVLAVGAGARLSAHQALQATTAEAATPTVNVVLPQGGEASAVVLPGRLDAWNEAPVFARTNGYLKRWDADIGDHVKAGQTLAEIDTPDVDQQLVAAKAALATADANRALADITAKRWDRLVVTHAVSQQEVDQNHGNLAAKEALENEARANVSRLQTLTDFKRLVAPFDGVVTSRATDIGSLIVAGDASSRPLFSVADISKLRLYVSVPQNYASMIKPGLTAHFTVPDHPNQSFTAQLVRTAGAVNTQSGAMLIQLVFDNSAGLLRPGAYAQVSLDVDTPKTVQASNNLRIPASALLFRKEGTAVAVADKNGLVHVQPVTIAQDFGATLAIGSGLTTGDMVIDSPSDAIVTGDRVKPVLTREAANAHS